ncbi:hybrid sensor histidine kinase/response regulator transcription factor [Winogradskyella marincola]|uniref:histidine kinase n=1 Tax=Winogradskyella marincola TaxID=3037795 RepID=A0ABT6G4Q7_9FLAO|nr:hybrid sensor histidine kinase/response regulator transcription factor [Winogradskyella sp. YYF002]MDG4717028.1 ATP-binding protein [Winogradskyella sp. YYF002]
MKIKLHFLLLLFFSVLSFSQNVRHLSVDDGLPQSFVSDIIEDDDGFVWIATRNGLARFDGHELKTINHVPGEDNSITSNIISKLQKGENKKLWIFYETEEVDLLNLRTGCVTNMITNEDTKAYEQPISTSSCVIDSKNRLWSYFDKQTVLLYTLDSLNKKSGNKYRFENDTIRSVFYDSNNSVWVYSQKGLNKYNEALDKFELSQMPFKVSYESNHDGDKNVSRGVSGLTERENGELMWFCKSYIYFYNPISSVYRRQLIPDDLLVNPEEIQTGPDGKEYFFVDNKIYSYDDLIGIKELGGIKPNKSILHEKDIDTQAFLVDKSGLIWVAVNTDGIYQVDLNIDFKTIEYKDDFAISIFKNQFNIALEDFYKFDLKRKGTLLPAYHLRTVKKDRKIWMAINRTVSYYDLDTKALTKLEEIPLDGTEDFIPLKGIAIGNEGSPLVIDENKNIYKYSLQTKKWEIHPSTSLLYKNFKGELKPNALIVDDENSMWITTEYNGLICIDRYGELKHFQKRSEDASFPTNNIINLIFDNKDKNILWIASYSGLIKLNKKTLQTDFYSKQEGLPDNTIYTIMQDDNGALWLGTNKGLCKFNPETQEQKTYTIIHGLPTMEFNRYHQLVMPNGRFALGGMSKGIIFDPLKIKEDDFSPNVAVTSVKVDNDRYNKNQQSFFQYNDIQEIHLPYNQNNLAIEFVALEYSYPNDIKYRYRLKGYNDGWIPSNNYREAVYTNISPGNYVFEVNSTNTSGLWSDKVKEIAIVISPPWWLTPWAIILFLVCAISLVYFFINWIIKQKFIRKEIELQRKEARHFREINKIKTKFFTNMTHELRTPLSLIIAPVEQLKNADNKKHKKQLLKIIKRNANNLLNLSDQLLDIAKLEAGMLKPNYLHGDIVVSLKKCIEAFKEEAKEKAISIDLISPLFARYRFSPYLLERIINNLVSNSIKYGFEGGKIEITMTESFEGLILKVEDDGTGISKKDLPHVFERFYQVNLPNNKSNSTGSGIGLALVYDLVKLQKGEIQIESQTGKKSGTTITIKLPYKKVEDITEPKLSIENQLLPQVNNDKDMPTVLIVEDNKEMLEFLSISLKPYYKIVLSESAEKGLKIAKAIIPEIIISDVMMTNMDGLELCKKLKKNIATNHIPIILLTAKTDMKSRLKGLTFGADDYITKPFSVSELLLRLKNRIEIQEKQRESLYEELKLLPNTEEEKTELKPKNDFLLQIDSILEENLDNEQFGVNDLALKLNMSRTSLHRKIKAVTNIPTGKIIQIYRLKRASSFLKEGFNISEASYKTGFGSPSYFTKCFKETYGLTPTEYIENQSVKQ